MYVPKRVAFTTTWLILLCQLNVSYQLIPKLMVVKTTAKPTKAAINLKHANIVKPCIKLYKTAAHYSINISDIRKIFHQENTQSSNWLLSYLLYLTLVLLYIGKSLTHSSSHFRKTVGASLSFDFFFTLQANPISVSHWHILQRLRDFCAPKNGSELKALARKCRWTTIRPYELSS